MVLFRSGPIAYVWLAARRACYGTFALVGLIVAVSGVPLVRWGGISILDELREISRGVHPASLSQSGLGAALRSLGRRASVPTVLDIRGIGRLAQPVEAAAHYVVPEALTYAVKYAKATVIHMDLGVNNTTLRLSIDDDGDGAADPALGSGIIGLIDRVDAMGGKLTLRSPLGEGTSLVIELPLEPAGELNGCSCAHLHLCRWLGISTREVLD